MYQGLTNSDAAPKIELSPSCMVVSRGKVAPLCLPHYPLTNFPCMYESVVRIPLLSVGGEILGGGWRRPTCCSAIKVGVVCL